MNVSLFQKSFFSLMEDKSRKLVFFICENLENSFWTSFQIIFSTQITEDLLCISNMLVVADTAVNKDIVLTLKDITKTSYIYFFGLACCLVTNTNWNYLIAFNSLINKNNRVETVSENLYLLNYHILSTLNIAQVTVDFYFKSHCNFFYLCN